MWLVGSQCLSTVNTSNHYYLESSKRAANMETHPTKYVQLTHIFQQQQDLTSMKNTFHKGTVELKSLGTYHSCWFGNLVQSVVGQKASRSQKRDGNSFYAQLDNQGRLCQERTLTSLEHSLICLNDSPKIEPNTMWRINGNFEKLRQVIKFFRRSHVKGLD